MQRLTPKLRLKLRRKLTLKLRLEPEARACSAPLSRARVHHTLRGANAGREEHLCQWHTSLPPA